MRVWTVLSLALLVLGGGSSTKVEARHRPQSIWTANCWFNGPTTCNESYFQLVSYGVQHGKFRSVWRLTDNPFILFDGQHNAVTQLTNAQLILTYSQRTQAYTLDFYYDYSSNVQDDLALAAGMYLNFPTQPAGLPPGSQHLGFAMVGGTRANGHGRQCGSFKNLHATIAVSPAYPVDPPSLSLLVTMPDYQGHC